MKKVLLTLTMMVLATIGYAQAPLDFEDGGNGANWTWTTFENDSNPALEFMDNPDKSGANTSNKVAKFTALATGAPWAGTTGRNGSTFLLNDNNRTIKIMVWKSVISDVGIKLETASGWAQPEIKVANTKVNEWEELTFDFSDHPNPPGEEFNGISLFPDFRNGRSENVIYLDNLTFSAVEGGGGGGEEPGGSSAYCNTTVTHFGIAAETASAVKLSIGNRDESSMFVSVESADSDPVDLLIVNNSSGPITGSPAVSEPVIENGKYTIILTWNEAPPAEVVLNVLWSKVSNPGNWMLSQQDVTVAFNATCGEGGGGTGETAPTMVAPFPQFSPDSVLSLYGEGYTPIEGVDFPDWGQSTVLTFEKLDDGNGGQNEMMVLTDLDYQGIQFATPLDITSMGFLHMHVWTANSTSFNVYLISTGPVERPYPVKVPTQGWAEVIVPLTIFDGVNLADVIQMKFDGNGTVYIDNLLFFRDATLVIDTPETEPSVAAPTPTVAATDVISVFSDAYTDLDGTNFNPGWGQATVTSEIEIEGNKTLSMRGLNYQGIELSGNVDVSAMTHLHLNYWTANSTTLKVFIISPGPVETPYTLTVPTEGWGGVDIALSEFAPVDLANVFQFKFEGNGDVFLDNIYFHKGEVVSVENTLEVATDFVLAQNYPNPFNPSTTISFTVANSADVKIEVFTIMGQKVATLTDGFKHSGSHTVSFDASKLASGTYMYRLTSGSTSIVRSMMLIK